MNTRQTSIDCYNQIKKENLLSKMRLKVLKTLLDISPATASEIEEEIGYENGSKSAHCRLPELRDLGVIYENGTRTCKVTGRNVIEWDLTDKLPIKEKSKKLPTKKEKKKQLMALIIKLGNDGELIEKDKKVLRLIYKIANNL
jgi:predicted transcriptional regulator